MKTLNYPRLVALTFLTAHFSVSAQDPLNSGAFVNLPESPTNSLGVENLNLIRILNYGGPNINWWSDTNTPGHSFSFDTNSTTGFFYSYFHTTNSLWLWSSANTNTPFAMRLTEAGKLTLGGTNLGTDGPIVLDANASGGPIINVAGGIAAQSLQISGAVDFGGTVGFGGSTITSFGSSLLSQADAGSARSVLGAAAQIDVPFFTSFGTSWVSHADAAAARAALGAAAPSDIPMFTSFGTSLVNQADAAAARIALGVAAPSDIPLFTSFGTSWVSHADAAAARSALGAATLGDIPTFTSFGTSLVSQVDAASARTLLGAAAQSDIPSPGTFGSTLWSQIDATSARTTLGIPPFSIFGSSLVGETDAESARAKLGIPSFTPFGTSLLNQPNAASARAVLGVPIQTEMLPFWKYVVETQSMSYGAISSPASTGSGVTYWPSRNTFLLLDNTSGAARVLEFNRNNVLVRTISLVGFGDPEDIHWISGNTFFISQERNSGSVDEIDVMDLPTTGNSVNITTAVRRLRINVNTFTSNSNAGLEGATLVGETFYFATEKGPSKPSSSDWYVWKCTNAGTGIITVTPTKAFRLTGLLYGRATDISGMATDGTYLWMISHEGPVANGLGRVFKTTLDGRLIEENVLPSFSDGSAWLQAEGIELFTDTDGKVKIALCGEIGSSPGVDFMILSPP